MRIKLIIIILYIVIPIISFSCVSNISESETHVLVINEEMLLEFQSCKIEILINKYRNRILQLDGEILKISTPESARQYEKSKTSAITLAIGNCNFVYFFDYNVIKQHSLYLGDKVIIQGSLYDFGRRIITEYDYEKKAKNEKYWEEVEKNFIFLRHSKLIPIL